MTAPGKRLENAISDGAEHYGKQRIKLAKLATPTFHDDNNHLQYGSKPPVDFAGALAGGKGVFIEAKEETDGASFPIMDKRRGLKTHQRRWMEDVHELGCYVRLVVALWKYGEVFSIMMPDVTRFMNAPWRESLSRDWLHAYGYLVPVVGQACRFLDESPTIEYEKARDRVEKEKARALAKPRRQLDISDLLNAGPPISVKMTPEERRAQTQRSFDEGCRRQQKAAGPKSGGWYNSGVKRR